MKFWGIANFWSARYAMSLTLSLLICSLFGCRTAAPIHVWQPSKVTSAPRSRVAVATLSLDPGLSQAVETSMLEQRPVARMDLAVISSQQLLEASPVRFASTASASGMIGSDLEALRCAKEAGAQLLLYGQIYSCDIDWNDDSKAPNLSSSNMNKTFFQRMGAKRDLGPNRHIVMSWNVYEVSTGKSIGSQQFRLTTHEVAKKHPDLQYLSERPSYQLLTAAARETWKSVTPTVEKAKVHLASPLFQPGALRVLWGVRAAKKGQWQTAEKLWSQVADSWLPTPAAHHNLAVAMAAREDFTSAKRELIKAKGPFSIRLPKETLVWLDNHHQLYNQAHQLGEPEEGWAFPLAIERAIPPDSIQPIDEAQLPWWAGLPGLPYQP